MQPLEEDGSNSIFVLHSPLNAKFVFEVNALTIVRTNDAPLCGRSFITTHHLVYVWIHWTHICVFVPFFFFFTRFGVTRLLFMYCSLNSNRKCWLFRSKPCINVLFMDPQIPLFSNFFIKNGSHGTIHTFKNYFATVFSVFSLSKINSIQTDP